MESTFVEKVVKLYHEKKWKEILNLNQAAEARKLLWVWPSENNLKLITQVLNEFQLRGVVSLGCGCGLFEWFLEQYSGLHVIGFEINQEWWHSKYCNPQFIKLYFPSLPPSDETFPKGYALLFCYFNNRKGFRDYMECYKGNLVIIIGPGPGAGRHTDPDPFNPDFDSKEWDLYKREEVRGTKDFVGIYKRKVKSAAIFNGSG